MCALLELAERFTSKASAFDVNHHVTSITKHISPASSDRKPLELADAYLHTSPLSVGLIRRTNRTLFLCIYQEKSLAAEVRCQALG
jgi:hypothetical protein